MLIYTQPYIRGSKKNTVMVELKDAANAPVTGKVAANITAPVIRWREALDSVNVSQLANSRAPFTGGGWVEVNAAALPGLYRFDLRNTDFVNDGLTDTLLVSVLCAGCQPVYLAIPLTDYDESASTRERSSGGTTNVNTTIAGLPIGTYTLQGGYAPGAGTVTNGGAGGAMQFGSGGVTSTGAGSSGSAFVIKSAGGNQLFGSVGAGGGGATGPGAGGITNSTTGYHTATFIAGGAASGTKGGGGAGGSSAFGISGAGGSNAVGAPCTIGYGGGGGGGAATFAGGNGCPGFLKFEWWN